MLKTAQEIINESASLIAEITRKLENMDDRLKNIEHRFLSYEHRTLPQLSHDTIVKPCPKCNAPQMSKRNEREWCSICGYKNWVDDSDGPVGL